MESVTTKDLDKTVPSKNIFTYDAISLSSNLIKCYILTYCLTIPAHGADVTPLIPSPFLHWCTVGYNQVMLQAKRAPTLSMNLPEFKVLQAEVGEDEW